MSSMVIVCDGCGARFRMNPALFRDAKGARIRCRKCGGHIEVRHPEESPAPPATEAPGAVGYEPVPTAVPAIREVVPGAESEILSVAEVLVPAEVGAPVEAQPNLPIIEPADASPEEEPTHAQPAPWMGTVPPPNAPDAAPAGEPEAATVHSGHLGRWDPRLEALLLPSTVTDTAPEPDSSREERAAEIASLKRRLRASRRRGPSMLTLFLLVVPGILLLAGGAFFFRDTKPARELLRKYFPPSGSGNTARVVSTPSAVVKPAYEIRDMKASYAKTFTGGNLFVIEGTVANVGKGPSRGIRVQATLLGKDNQALVNSTVFAANLVDNTTLRHSNRALIEGFLGWRYGQRNANRDIPAGASLPFMVVFFDPPERIEYFTAKALDAE